MTPTYPGNRSNEPAPNDEVFRDLSIINQPAGHLQFVNTKDDEILDIGYKDGSFLRFTKFSTDQLVKNDKRTHVMGDKRDEINGNNIEIIDKDKEQIISGDNLIKIGDVDKWQKYQEQWKSVVKNKIHQIRRLFEIKRTKQHNKIDQGDKQTKSGSLATTPSDEISTKTLVITSPTEYTPGSKIPCAHTLPVIVDSEYSYENKTASDGWGEFSGWGTGNSPSSQDGTWDSESSKEKLAQTKVQIQQELFDLEKQLGQNKHRDGGTKIEKIAKDYIGIVGLAFNDQESFRKDPKGKLVPYGIKIDPFGNSVYTQYRESSLVENISTDQLPGGRYDLVVGDGFNLTVGSNGISMKTTGHVERYGSTIVETSESHTIHSNGELSLGGERVDLTGEIITLRPKKIEREIEDSSGNATTLTANAKNKTEPEQQVLIDGNLNVALNAIVAGGMHVEGELTVHHITAPMEIQITDECFEWGTQSPCALDSTNDSQCAEPPKSPVYGDIVEGCIIGHLTNMIYGTDSAGGQMLIYADVVSDCSPNSIMCHPHYHNFKNIPLKLFRDNVDTIVTVGAKTDSASLDPHSAVRAVGARNNFANRVLALPVKNSTTENTVLEKFNGSVCSPLEISNGNWIEPNENETIPSGEGVRSSNYTEDILNSKIDELNSKWEARYKELQDKLDQLVH